MIEDVDFIAAFLRIFESEPELFEEVEALEGLGELDELLGQFKNDSNQEVADAISNWCEDYPDLTDAVVTEASSGKARESVNSQGKNGKLAKLFPNLYKNLKGRI